MRYKSNNWCRQSVVMGTKTKVGFFGCLTEFHCILFYFWEVRNGVMLSTWKKINWFFFHFPSIFFATLHCTDPLKKIVKKWEKVHKKFVFVFNPFLVIHSITIHYLISYARGFDGKTPNFTKTISSNQDVCKYTISFILACWAPKH